MRERQNKAKKRIGKKGRSSGTDDGGSKGKGPPPQGELSVQETQSLYSGLEERVEVRVAGGLFSASGKPKAVVALATLAGFFGLVFKHMPLEACLLGALGAWLVWILVLKENAKS